MPSHPMHRSLSTSLLVWGGAPGTTSDGTSDDRDAPVVSLAVQSGDDPEPDEHVDWR